MGYAETKFFSNTLQLTLNNGFKATLNQPNIWRMIYVWNNADGKKLMEIEGNILSSICISFDDSHTATPYFLPVLFTGLKHLMQVSINAG